MKKTILIIIPIVCILIVALLVLKMDSKTYSLSEILGIDLENITYFKEITQQSTREDFIKDFSNVKFVKAKEFNEEVGTKSAYIIETYEFGNSENDFVMEIIHYPIDCYKIYTADEYNRGVDVQAYKKQINN